MPLKATPLRLPAWAVYTGAVTQFVWDEHNREHVRDHGVEPDDAEDALRDPDAIGVEAENRGERRWAVLGTTEHGRLLLVVFTRRDGSIRVITARPASARDARRYRKQQR